MGFIHAIIAKILQAGTLKFPALLFDQLLGLAAIEYMYRGFLLFGLKEKFKEGSILIQTIPFVLMHLGKPEIETISCLFTGIFFGYMAYRGSFLAGLFHPPVYQRLFCVAG